MWQLLSNHPMIVLVNTKKVQILFILWLDDIVIYINKMDMDMFITISQLYSYELDKAFLGILLILCSMY